ncbi:hypothetical protein K353_04134 [Kitasatospora sp. SolWspMP-SS2h]|nr:hypothetical protein K353_04134 [Kitasatospora sp. SolWspMP-SS2h]
MLYTGQSLEEVAVLRRSLREGSDDPERASEPVEPAAPLPLPPSSPASRP